MTHILHTFFSHSMGGLEQSFVDTTEALVLRGHRVTALLRADAPYREEVARHAGIITLEPRGFYDIASVWRVRRILKTLRPDGVLAHNARAISLMKTAALGLGIPVIGVSHSYKTRRTVRANALVVLSEHMRAHFIAAGYPAHRTTVIPNLIRLPEFSPPMRHAPPVIGALGRFTPEKGFIDFLTMLAQLQRNGVECTAHIGGDGVQKKELQALANELGIANRITWMGWVEDKPAFYAGLDVLCVPSREESFGLVVLEGLAHGIPVVSTDTPGPSEILTHGVNGYIVPRGDTQVMAAAIERALGHTTVEAGYKRAQDFGFEAVAGQWDKLLQQYKSSH